MKTELRRISCHGRNYSQPYFFKRNQSSDNRSHGFGAKFLLKKLSASDFSYERKSAFMGQRRWKVFCYSIIWGNRLKGKYIERCRTALTFAYIGISTLNLQRPLKTGLFALRKDNVEKVILEIRFLMTSLQTKNSSRC